MTPVVGYAVSAGEASAGVAMILVLAGSASDQRWLIKASFVLEAAAFAAFGVASLLRAGAL